MSAAGGLHIQYTVAQVVWAPGRDITTTQSHVLRSMVIIPRTRSVRVLTSGSSNTHAAPPRAAGKQNKH